jgi:RHS repeat-associated protein
MRYGTVANQVLSEIGYEYDLMGRLARVNTIRRDGTAIDTDASLPGNQPESTTYHFDQLGRPDYTELPGGIVEDFEFDNLDQLDFMRHVASDTNNTDLTDNALLDLYDYEYRADGKRESLTETVKLNGIDRTTTYDWTYDPTGRLVNETIDHWDDANDLDQSETFVFDLAGNRTSKTVDKFGANNDRTTKFVYDNNDRLQSETVFNNLTGTGTPAQSTTYTWNETQQASKTTTIPTVSSVTQDFLYGLVGQLERVTTTTSGTSGVQSRERVEYRYNASGIRMIAIDSVDSNLATADFDSQLTGRVEYLIEQSNPTGYAQTVIETKYNSNNQATERTSFTFATDELTQTKSPLDPSSGAVLSTATHTFGHDGHGSVRSLFDANAAASIVQFFTYTAFGEMLSLHNAVATLGTQASALTSLQYNGESIDSRTGLYNFRARWYSASSGRFDRYDPFAGNPNDPFSFNKFGFVHGDPIGGVDPTGGFVVGLASLFVTAAINSHQLQGEGAKVSSGRYFIEALGVSALLSTTASGLYSLLGLEPAKGAIYGFKLGLSLYVAFRMGGNQFAEAIGSGLINALSNATSLLSEQGWQIFANEIGNKANPLQNIPEFAAIADELFVAFADGVYAEAMEIGGNESDFVFDIVDAGITRAVVDFFGGRITNWKEAFASFSTGSYDLAITRLAEEVNEAKGGNSGSQVALVTGIKFIFAGIKEMFTG